MDLKQIQERLNRIEECADEARSAMLGDVASSSALRESVNEMHRQAREVRNMAQQQQGSDVNHLVEQVESLEQIGDRAAEACQAGGSAVGSRLQLAIRRAHDAISGLKQQMH